MNPSGLQAAVVLPTLADLGCLPLPCASGAAEASDSIGGAEQKKNSNTYLSTESGEVHTGLVALPLHRLPESARVDRGVHSAGRGTHARRGGWQRGVRVVGSGSTLSWDA